MVENQSLDGAGSKTDRANQEERQVYVLPIITLILSLIAYAFVPLFIRWSEVELSPVSTIFNRCWISTIILAGWQFRGAVRGLSTLRTKGSNLIDSSDRASPKNFLNARCNFPNLVWGITALSFAIAPVFWSWSLTQTTVANSSLIHNLTPVFTTVGGWLIFRNSIKRQFLVGTLIATGGAIALGIDDAQFDPRRILGDVLALISAALFAVNLMGMASIRARASGTSVVFWLSLTGTFVTLAISLLLGERLFPVSASGWLAVVLLATLGQILAVGLMTYTLGRLSAGLVALVFLLDPMLTAVAAWFAFGETLSVQNAIAFVVVLVGVYFGLTA